MMRINNGLPGTIALKNPEDGDIRQRRNTRLVLLFIVTEDWYFVSHRLQLAKAAMDAGYKVHVACRTGAAASKIREAGIVVHPIAWTRSDGVLRNMVAVLALYRLLRRVRPSIVHNVALKSILFGSIASRIAGVPRIINAVTGLGYAFASSSVRARLTRRLIVTALRLGADHPGSTYLFQNSDDKRALARAGAIRQADSALIRGAGIDIQKFTPAPEPTGGPFTLAVVCRMLAIKGVGDVVEASKILHTRNLQHRLLLVGAPDGDNASSISHATLEEWAREPTIEWLGERDDITTIWARSHLAVLASHGGEGLPKSLLEAAACGRAIVATDVPGNREIAIAGRNALLVPPRNPRALADAIFTLATDEQLREDYAREGLIIARSEFSDEKIQNLTIRLYRK